MSDNRSTALNVLASDTKAFRSMADSPSLQEKIAKSMARGLDKDRLIELCISTVNRTPELGDCTVMSILLGLIKSAQFGLEIGGVNSEAYLVPFWNSKIGAKEALMIPGYRGLMKLVLRSGEVASLNVQAVYRGEECTVELGDNPSVTHRAKLDVDRSDANIVAVYMVATFVNGRRQVEIMNRKDIEKVRASSKAKNAMAWTDWWGEMARKTVVRRGCKYLPMQSDIRELHEDEDREMGLVDRDDLGEAPVRGIAGVAQRLNAAKQLAASNTTREPIANTETGEEIPSDFVEAGAAEPQQEQASQQQSASEQPKAEQQKAEPPKQESRKRPIVVSAEQTESSLVDAAMVANIPEATMRSLVAAWCKKNNVGDFYKDTTPASRVKVVEAIRDGKLQSDGTIN